MSIPDFQSSMLPLLQLMGDGKEHPNQELTQALAELMSDYGVGVSTGRVYEVKRIDYDYFEDG